MVQAVLPPFLVRRLTPTGFLTGMTKIFPMTHLPSRLQLLPDRLTPAVIAVLYALFAGLWIIASGALLTFAVADPALQGRIEMAKGMVFVIVTSGLLYLLLKVWREPAGMLPALQQGDIQAA